MSSPRSLLRPSRRFARGRALPEIDPPPSDDPAIADNWQLLRRIPKWIVDDKAGGSKLSRQAFEDLEGSVSVYVEERLGELQLTDNDVLDGHPGYGLLSVEARTVRDCQLGIVWDPEEGDGLRGQAHAGVMGNKTPSRRRQLVDGSEVRVWPGQVSPQPTT